MRGNQCKFKVSQAVLSEAMRAGRGSWGQDRVHLAVPDWVTSACGVRHQLDLNLEGFRALDNNRRCPVCSAILSRLDKGELPTDG